ncbi:vWA domain-containing protein [Tautonia sociabilis]|uniref:VWA domain-containing protein n=1 Tax=Tautonia sociabilis TaxID=2080755 RepID=A0A432MCW5_9BACT|nr:BatA and WFA domain-containing protein [Tautonia sociabilis]RUL82208.1 VWA domain-containing protein [Tautonia sociabilis]
MDFSLIHAGLAAGAALAVVPLIIHLVLRQTPKRIVFPALRLLQQRHQRSTKRLRVKNWLLLLARMALIALMALALARPALNARVPLGDREVPTALALVVDTSLSMGYVDKGKSRLDQAKEVAAQILRKLPDSSQVYLIDSGVPAVPAPVSPSAARKRLEGLELRAANRPLNEGLERAYQALAESRRDLPRLEAYVLTDLARSSWEVGQRVAGRDRVRERSGRDVSTFLIRLAPESVRDAAVVSVEARPASEPEPDGRRPFEVVATIRNAGPAETRLVEFELDGAKRGQQDVELPADGQIEVAFRTPAGLEPGLHQAAVRLEGVDPLPHDDDRFVTFESSPAFDVLVVYDPDPDDEPRSIDATFVAGALDPQATGIPNRVETLSTEQFRGRFPRDLSTYACIFINNVARLPAAAWGQLAEYVRNGGGVVIALGQNTDPADYASEAARAVLPGKPGDPVSPAGGTAFGSLADPSHPLFTPYTRELTTDLASIPVFSYRSFQPIEAPTVRPLLSYQDGSPALIESTFDGPQIGRVLLWTTPLSRRPTPDDPDAWNEFPTILGNTGWSFLMLMQRTVPYLAGAAGSRLNYEAGEIVILPLEPSIRAPSYVVQGPTDRLIERINPDRDAAELIIEGPEAPGHWAVLPSGREAGRVDDRPPLGFSINPRPEEANFRTIEDDELEAIFGDPDAFALANSPDEIERVQRTGRIGRELFPWIMVLILLLLTAENYLANRFHRETPAAVAVGGGNR